MNQTATNQRTIIDAKTVMARVGIKARSTLWRRGRNPNDDFPAPVDVGYGMNGWYEDEIDAWINSRPRVNWAPGNAAA